MIDQLRDLGLDEHISVPRIAMFGTQSSGKSSLLESIVGYDILPKSSGVCTRRPLEMRLVNDQFLEQPYAEFEKELKGQKITDLSKIKEIIEELTEKKCGKGTNIVDDPIVLKIFSKTTPDLTLIDLPGLTRIPFKDQPKNIYEITSEMCKRYCSDPRTIILCVLPANIDMTTSEAIQLAQEMDPNGIRTIGAITKIDIMDKGTNARKLLLNEEVMLKLGYVGVMGRSQLDLQQGLSV